MEEFLAQWGASQSTSEGNDELDAAVNEVRSLQETFAKAYQDGDWNDVVELLDTQSSIEVNCHDADGKNAIYWAAGDEGGKDALLKLLRKGADPNIPTATGYSALNRAVRKGFLENVESLISANASLEQCDPGGETPLLMAILYRQQEVCTTVLNKGARLDAVLNDGAGAVYLAIEMRITDIFSALLTRGAEIKTSDNWGSTPLHIAIRLKRVSEAQKIIASLSEDPGFLNKSSPIYGAPL